MPAADQMANDQESGIGFADRPYGDASRIDKSLKAMTTMGGGDTPLAPLAPVQSPDAVERNALASVVAPGTPAQYKSQFAPDVTAAQRMYESGAGITAPRPGGLPQAAGDLLGGLAGLGAGTPVDWLNPLHDLATAYGETVDPLLGLIEKTAGDKAAQQAYLANLHTLDGGDPAATDFFATTRALRAAHQAAQDEAAAIANDPNAPPLIRWLSALQNAADITAQFTLPVPGVGEIGASVKALRGARGADVVRGPISPAEMELARAEPVTVLTPPETPRVELGGEGPLPLAQQPLGSRIVARSAEQQAAEAGTAASAAQEAKAPGATAGVIGRTASGPEIVGNLNLDRVTQDPAIKSIYRATYNGDPTAFEAAMGHGPRAERVAEAQVIVHNALMSGTTPAEYVASVAEKAQKPAEVGAARLMVDLQTDKAWKATQEYQALREASLDPASGGSVDPVALRQAALDATKAVLDQFAVQKDIAGVASKAGQTLDMFNHRLNVIDRLSASGTDTSAAFGSAMKLIFGVDELAKQTAFVKALVDLPATDHIGISALIRTILEDPAYKAAPAVNFGWWVNHLRVNALMSPLTFARVAASNVWKIGTTPIELYGVTAAQGIAHALTGAERSTSLAATNAFTKTLATTGVARGLSAGLYSFLHNISVKQLLYDETGAVSITAPQGVSPLNREFYKPISPPGMRYPGKNGGVVGTAGARVADVTGIIGRTISAIETSFREALVPAHLAMDGARKAESMGLKHGSPEYMAVVQKYINDPSYSVAQQAALFAREYTFNSKNPGVKTAAFLDLRNKIPLGNAIVPFANAPSHIFRDFIQQTPFGLPPVAKLQYKLSGGKIGELAPQGIETAKGMDTGMPALGHETESAMRYARAIKGTLAAAWIVNQMQAGNIRGLNPYQYGTTEYDIWNKQGPEFSVQLPWGWMTLDAIQPLGRMVRTAAAWEQGIASNGGHLTPEAIGHAVLDMARTQFDESWFSSLSNLNDALAGAVGGNTAQRDRAAQSFLMNIGSQAIPLSGTLRVINHAMGGNTKDPRGFDSLSDYLTANLPLLSRAVPDRVGLGGPEHPVAGGGAGAFSPINIVRPAASDVENTLLALKQHGYTIPEPSLTNSSAGRGAQYSDADLASLKNLAYPRMLDAINAAVHDPGWAKLDEAQQAKMLATKVDAVRTEVKYEFARDTLINSSDPKTIIRGALSGLATQNTFGEKALWIGFLDKSGKLTPDVVKAIEDSAKVVLPGQTPEKPVAEYRKAAPLVQAYLDIPPFRSGNETEWAAYAQAREDRLDIEADMKAKNNGKAPSAFMLENAIRQQNPQMATLLAKYDANLMADSRRAALIKANPWLSTFVASFAYTQHPTGTPVGLPAANP